MVQRLLGQIYRYKYISLALALTLSIVGIESGPHLPIRLSISELLPEDRTSVVQMKNVASYVGGVGFVVGLIGPTDQPEKYLPEVAQKWRQLEHVNYVFYEPEEHSLGDRALYLMPKDDFKKLNKHIRILFQGKDSLSLGLGGEERRQRQITAAKDFFKELKDKTTSEAFFLSKDKRYAMLLAKPSFNSEDLKKSKKLVRTAEQSLRDVVGPEVPIHIVGRFANKVRDTKQIQQDMAKTGMISFIGLCLVLFWGLGSGRAMLVTMGGMMVSLGWTVGLAKATVGQINILTGFLLAILGGLGVEYGVHLIRRYEQERRLGRDHEEALRFTHSHMGRTLFSAAITSSAAFLILSISDFRGFSELGITAGLGILSIYMSYMLCFPALGFMMRGKPRFANSRRIFGIYPAKTSWALPIVLVIGMIFSGLTFSEFEYDFARMHKLSAESVRLNELSNALFGKSLTPAAILAKDRQQAAELKDWLNEDQHNSVIQQAVALDTLLPDDMASRQRRIRKLQRRIDDVSNAEITEKTGLERARIDRWLAQKPYRAEDLPERFRNTFGPTGRVVFAYPSESLNQAAPLRRFTGVLEQARLKFPGAQIGSDAMVFVEILDHIINDGQIVLLLFLIGAFLVFWLDFKSVRGALILEVQLIFGILILCGLMGLIGERFSILNVAMIPAVLAAGVDMGVHVRHRQLEGHSALSSARFVAQAVQLSALTTMIGFGALFFAQAGMLKGIAWISVLGQISMYLVCMIFVPVLRESFWRKLILFWRKRSASSS